jgi:hypothetical protein
MAAAEFRPSVRSAGYRQDAGHRQSGGAGPSAERAKEMPPRHAGREVFRKLTRFFKHG